MKENLTPIGHAAHIFDTG